MKIEVKVGQVWRDTDIRNARRLVRVDAIEQRGLWRIARISSSIDHGVSWKRVTRFIRIDRLPKRYKLMADV